MKYWPRSIAFGLIVVLLAVLGCGGGDDEDAGITPAPAAAPLPAPTAAPAAAAQPAPIAVPAAAQPAMMGSKKGGHLRWVNQASIGSLDPTRDIYSFVTGDPGTALV